MSGFYGHNSVTTQCKKMCFVVSLQNSLVISASKQNVISFFFHLNIKQLIIRTFQSFMSSKTPNAFKFLLKIYAKHPSDFDERANNKRNKQTKEELRIALQSSTGCIGYSIIRCALTT